MKPNPLEDMEEREARDELFSNALLKVFGDVLSRYDIKDRDVQIKMIEEITQKVSENNFNNINFNNIADQ